MGSHALDDGIYKKGKDLRPKLQVLFVAGVGHDPTTSGL